MEVEWTIVVLGVLLILQTQCYDDSYTINFRGSVLEYELWSIE